jgi:hypothetical protein
MDANVLFSSIVYESKIKSSIEWTSFCYVVKQTHPPDIFLDPLNPKTTEDKPDFQRSETTTEAKMPVAVVDDGPWQKIFELSRRNDTVDCLTFVPMFGTQILGSDVKSVR